MSISLEFKKTGIKMPGFLRSKMQSLNRGRYEMPKLQKKNIKVNIAKEIGSHKQRKNQNHQRLISTNGANRTCKTTQAYKN